MLLAIPSVYFSHEYNQQLTSMQWSGVKSWSPSPEICFQREVPHFIPVNLICNMTTFRKEKKNGILTPPEGSRVGVRAKYLLAYYCMLHSL